MEIGLHLQLGGCPISFGAGCLAGLLVLGTSNGVGAPAAASPESLDPRLPGFIKAKEQQARALAKALDLKVASGVWKTFELYARGDWAEATNQFIRLSSRAGQYEHSWDDKTVHNPVWQPLAEVCCAFESFAFGEPKFARAFGDDIIASIPKGSIYFGGTDPGRGLVTALCKSHENADPFFTITQNALADDNYLVYLRQMYGKRIYIPTTNDSQQCFNDYLQDAQERLKENKLKPGEDVQIVNGRVQVSGQVAVMAINGLLTKVIFDQNPEREFYVEESFPLDWMYPHLRPNGLIMRIERKPIRELSEEQVRKDQEYWRSYVGRLVGDWLSEETTVRAVSDFANKVYLKRDLAGFTGDPKYVTDQDAQKAFSKLRSSIGGLYAWRMNEASLPAVRERMTRAADLAFRQAVALCPYSPEAVFRYVQLLLSKDRLEDALLVAITCKKFDQSNAQVQDLVNRLLEIRKQKAKTGDDAKPPAAK